MRHPNQYTRNIAKPTRWTMQRCYAEWRSAEQRARDKRADRIDMALCIAGGLLAICAVIAAIMGT